MTSFERNPYESIMYDKQKASEQRKSKTQHTVRIIALLPIVLSTLTAPSYLPSRSLNSAPFVLTSNKSTLS
jgi:hypothetical protein